jgi:hypothetical protein
MQDPFMAKKLKDDAIEQLQRDDTVEFVLLAINGSGRHEILNTNGDIAAWFGARLLRTAGTQ